jgi:hypothetical protein
MSNPIPNRNALMSPRAEPEESSLKTPDTPSPVVSSVETPSPVAAINTTPVSSPESPVFPEVPSNKVTMIHEDDFPEAPSHTVDFGRKVELDNDVSTESSEYRSDSSARDALNRFGESPPNPNNEMAHNDYYKRFLDFHKNPTMSRTLKPFAKGRRRRTKKCKPCKRRRPCKKTKKCRKRHYKKGRKSHRRR